MKYNLCSCCQWFNPAYVTVSGRIPKHCTHDKLKSFAGLSVKGFPSGIDIVHCDYFTQPSLYCGDVHINVDGLRGVSYIIPNLRESRLVPVSGLYDNSSRIRIVSLNN